MDALRRFLWTNFGATLNRKTVIISSLILLIILCALLFTITHLSVFLILTLLTSTIGGLIVFGSSYRAIDWALSDKEKRQQIEEETALKQLRDRAREKHFQH
ncbi:hypothetical protein KSF_068610 [Reticulibacter mediterranei]|uniref:Uncharacterized protein n=1 Tax=Reticulibacter mediterranei TaxID=2778369 RepID=A0A8J3IMM2_9CHLR|nr:hypothetical protein [Reticulibacter mediterranei]GHO96813.1 hypothetical protein KSF_068610 [Reticulibacter mediterranei]